MTLAEIDIPGRCRVVAAARDDDSVQSRLYALGLFPGVELDVLRRAPLGDPMQIKLGHALISVRGHDARLIEVAPLS